MQNKLINFRLMFLIIHKEKTMLTIYQVNNLIDNKNTNLLTIKTT